MLTVKLLCLQSLKAVIRCTFPLYAKKVPIVSKKAKIVSKKAPTGSKITKIVNCMSFPHNFFLGGGPEAVREFLFPEKCSKTLLLLGSAKI